MNTGTNTGTHVTADIAMRIRAARPDDNAPLLPLLHELGYPGTPESASAQLAIYAGGNTSRMLVADGASGSLAGLIAGHLIPATRKAAVSARPCSMPSNAGSWHETVCATRS
ncbi:MAG: hypothetical protein ACYCOY_12865 [Metallibacterium sp.]